MNTVIAIIAFIAVGVPLLLFMGSAFLDSLNERFPSNEKLLELERQKQKTIELQEKQKENDYENRKKELEEEFILKIKKEEDSYENRKKELENDFGEKIKYQEKIIRDFDKIIIEKCNYYPQLAVIMSDLLTVYYERSAKFLEDKQHPARNEAMRIRDLKKETQKVVAEKKLLEYQLVYIKSIFPNITDILDPCFEEDSFILETTETSDKARNYLTDEEYNKLSDIERNQLALDRYVFGRKKSKWQIGRDYEMFIGYLCEESGYRVNYMGILKKLEDMGRDLIVTKDFNTYIIQCKYWAQHKEIHENHIFQLYGTVILYKIQHPFEKIEGVFVTPNNLSKTASQVAKELDIKVIKKEIGPFPRIKCNINRTTKEKIYHLPFDQQYDTTIIEKDRGEFFAYTVKEAYDKGFRRALKHFIS